MAASQPPGDAVPSPYAGPREASQPYSPIPLNRAPIAPPPVAVSPGQGRGRAIAIGVGVAALIGIVVAIVVAASGGSDRSQRDELVHATFAALGDEKRMTALVDAERVIDAFLDCSPSAKVKDADDDLDVAPPGTADREPAGKRSRERHLERTQQDIERATDMAKGAKIEVLEILSKPPATDPPASSSADAAGVKRQEAGVRVMSGCVAKVDHLVQLAKVKLRVTPEGREAYEDRVTLALLRVDGDRWYVLAPPRVFTGRSEIVAEARTFRDRMCDCKDYDCVESVDGEYDRWRDRSTTSDLPEDEDAGLDSVRDDYRACQRAMEEASRDTLGPRAITAMTALRDEMCLCKDAACARRVRSLRPLPDSFDLTERDRDAFVKLRDAFTECSTLASAGSAVAYDPAFQIAPDIAPACADYARAMQKLAACSAYPAGAKDDLKESFQLMMGLWKGYSAMRPELQRATVDTCISGRRSTEESITKYGC